MQSVSLTLLAISENIDDYPTFNNGNPPSITTHCIMFSFPSTSVLFKCRLECLVVAVCQSYLAILLHLYCLCYSQQFIRKQAGTAASTVLRPSMPHPALGRLLPGYPEQGLTRARPKFSRIIDEKVSRIAGGALPLLLVTLFLFSQYSMAFAAQLFQIKVPRNIHKTLPSPVLDFGGSSSFSNLHIQNCGEHLSPENGLSLSYNFIVKKVTILQMQANKQYINNQQSKISLDQNGESQRKLINPEESNQLQQVIKRQQALKKNLAFWNAMADGRLETISSCINLLVLLLLLTLGGTLYNGKTTNGAWVLGWIMIAQVGFFYLLVLLVKFIYIPSIERDIQQNSSQGFKLYNTIDIGKKQIKNLEQAELELLEATVLNKSENFRNCFPGANQEAVINEIRATYGARSTAPYQPNHELKNVKLREKNAKYWQGLWQNFVLGKTFSIPGVLLLVFIITPLSVATPARTDENMKNGQGYLAVGFWGAAILVFIIIKLFLWDYLNNKVENARSDSFIAYHPVNLKQKDLKNFTLPQLESLEKVLLTRSEEFENCFKENSGQVLAQVRANIAQRLPNREEASDLEIKEIVNNEKGLQSYSAAWTSFFNLRMIATIINVLKFLIVAAITFVEHYPATADDLINAQSAIGSVGIGCFVFGYLFYIFVKAWYLGHLEEVAYEGRSSPFTTFRLVYFGNKSLKDLEVHELEDVSDALNLRTRDFSRCFPKANPDTLNKDIKNIINQKYSPYPNSEQIYSLLQDDIKGRKSLAFWTGFVDNPLMTSMYSVYVLLVLLIVSLTRNFGNANFVMGYVGVANLSALICTVVIFKGWLLDYMANTTKSLKIEGYTEFHLVSTGAKELKDVELAELEKIQKIVETNPIEFRKCFPKSGLQSTLNDVKEIIAIKVHQKNNARVLNTEEKVKHQKLQLELNRCKVALAAWTSLIVDKLYVLTPLAIVIYILWAQCIATTLYGVTVCGFLTVANLSIIALLITYYNVYYRGYLEETIRHCQRQIKALETNKNRL